MNVSRRERQADQTRREIVAAARPLFAAQGYAKTTVAQIAEAAGVSVQTIYDSLGSKAAIVAALNELIDLEADIPALASGIPTSEDPEELVAIAVSICRNINERCGDILTAISSAAFVEPELVAVLHEGQRRHREGVSWLAGRLAQLDALADGIDQERAADAIAVLTEAVVARALVTDYGWSFDRYDEWANEMLCRLVLNRPGGGGAASSRQAP